GTPSRTPRAPRTCSSSSASPRPPPASPSPWPPPRNPADGVNPSSRRGPVSGPRREDHPLLWPGLPTRPPHGTEGLTGFGGDLRSGGVPRSGDRDTTGGRPRHSQAQPGSSDIRSSIFGPSMPTHRRLIGLASGSGNQAVDAALVELIGVGLELSPGAVYHLRQP